MNSGVDIPFQSQHSTESPSEGLKFNHGLFDGRISMYIILILDAIDYVQFW